MPEEPLNQDFANAQIHSFLNNAKDNGGLDAGISYLIYFSQKENKLKLRMSEEVLKILNDSADSLGLISGVASDGWPIISEDKKHNIRSFFQDKKNLSIAKDANINTKRIIKSEFAHFDNEIDNHTDSHILYDPLVYEKRHEITEAIEYFLQKNNRFSSPAIKALASIAIKGKIVDSVLSEQPNLLPILKEEAEKAGFIDAGGNATMLISDSLKLFFLDRPSIDHVGDYITQTYHDVERQLLYNQESSRSNRTR